MEITGASWRTLIGWPHRLCSDRVAVSVLATCLLLSLSVSRSYGQEALRPAAPRFPDSISVSSVGFDRILNTFTWNGTLIYDRDFHDLEVRFRQLLRSRLIRTDQRSIQDEYDDSLVVATAVATKWKMLAQQVSSVVSDNRAIDLTQLAQHQFLGGFKFSPDQKSTFDAYAGYEIDAQQAERDVGFSYRADGESRDIQFEEFRGAFRGHWAQSLLTRRRPADANLDISVVRDFGAEARNTILFSYNDLRREFYTAADPDVQRVYQVSSNIFRRIESSYDVSEQLEYRATDRMQFYFHGGVLNRTIDRSMDYKVLTGSSSPLLDTRIQELQLYGELATSYQPVYWLGFDLSIAYREREERHRVTEVDGVAQTLYNRQQQSEGRLDNIAQRTSVTSQIRTILSDADQLNFAGSASILRYDTPDSLNVDERDELLVTLGFQETHRFSSVLSAALAGDVTLSHLVYLRSAQSANNNWNRVLRLTPSVLFVPDDWLRTNNQAEVLANYTVYDFEDPTVPTRSFSFRQASWMDSTFVRMTRRLSLNLEAEVRIYEQGVLKWQEFAESPQNYFVERTFWPKVSYTVVDDLRIGIGYRYFSQYRYQYQGTQRNLDRRLESSGPTVALEWEGASSQRVIMEGWNETQMLDGVVTRTVPNVSLKVNFSL